MHSMNPVIKILAIGLLFAAVLSINSLTEAAILFVVLIFLFKIGNIPFGIASRLALYPAFFSLLFALFKMAESWQAGVLIIVRSVLAALTMLLLISTTPYNKIMGIFSIFMPPLLVDIFIFTYRAFFILVDQMGSMLRSIRLKGGYHRKNWSLNMKNMASTLGVLILHSIEMSERMYMIYTLRGYDGKIHVRRDIAGISISDMIFLSFCTIVLIGVIVL